MSGATLKRTLVALPGVGVSLLPKPDVSGLLASLCGDRLDSGLGFLVSTKCLLLSRLGFLESA
jgi:hypothetical protein